MGRTPHFVCAIPRHPRRRRRAVQAARESRHTASRAVQVRRAEGAVRADEILNRVISVATGHLGLAFPSIGGNLAGTCKLPVAFAPAGFAIFPPRAGEPLRRTRAAQRAARSLMPSNRAGAGPCRPRSWNAALNMAYSMPRHSGGRLTASLPSRSRDLAVLFLPFRAGAAHVMQLGPVRVEPGARQRPPAPATGIDSVGGGAEGPDNVKRCEWTHCRTPSVDRFVGYGCHQHRDLCRRPLLSLRAREFAYGWGR
jgi:hypothetical protein